MQILGTYEGERKISAKKQAFSQKGRFSQNACDYGYYLGTYESNGFAIKSKKEMPAIMQAFSVKTTLSAEFLRLCSFFDEFAQKEGFSPQKPA